jgi:hypothetical protein
MATPKEFIEDIKSRQWSHPLLPAGALEAQHSMSEIVDIANEMARGSRIRPKLILSHFL